MSLEFLNEITASEEAAYNYLVQFKVLKQTPPNCNRPDCGRQMTKVKRSDSQDGFGFRYL